MRTTQSLVTINIIGTGRVGTTLGYLFHHHQIFTPQCLLNRQLISGKKAQQWIGAGEALTAIEKLKPAKITLITVPDDQIAEVAASLAKSRSLRPDDIVLHCSGALSSAYLTEKLGADVWTASVHPVLSFAAPKKTDLNCYCTLEGHPQACSLLQAAFSAIGGKMVCIQPLQKLSYHAATVMVSNYLIGLLHTALLQLKRIDMDESLAMALIEPLVEQSIHDFFNKGPHAALTGPIARGDWQIVQQEIDELKQNNQMHAELYRLLGNMCLTLLREKHPDQNHQMSKLQQVLE